MLKGQRHDRSGHACLATPVQLKSVAGSQWYPTSHLKAEMNWQLPAKGAPPAPILTQLLARSECRAG
eukprot:scaffold73279_cov18-Tisochrysis_lutea.AAC.1